MKRRTDYDGLRRTTDKILGSETVCWFSDNQLFVKIVRQIQFAILTLERGLEGRIGRVGLVFTRALVRDTDPT